MRFLLNFDRTAPREYDVYSNNNINDDLFWLGDRNFFSQKSTIFLDSYILSSCPRPAMYMRFNRRNNKSVVNRR